MEETSDEMEKTNEALQQEQQRCQELTTECDELSTVASDICDGITLVAAADQSESPDDVAVATSDVASPTPNAPPSTPATVDDEEALDIIRTTPPDGIIDDNGGMITAEEMNMAELKVRVVCQEKANMALRMELKCAELQVAAKEKIDAKKTRLVELLDAKLAQVEKKNVHLIEMMEQVVKEKETHSRRMTEATKNLEELGRKLADSEKVNNELRSMNSQLKTMLENMEGKGTKIAQIAKEKLHKYREENVKLQQQLDQTKTDAEAQMMTSSSELLTSVERAEVLHRQLMSGLQCAMSDSSPTVEGQSQALSTATGTCVELEQVLQTLRRDAETTTTAIAHQAPDHADNANVDGAAAATIAELERQNAELRESKDREVAALNSEVKRLRAAIGQLVGVGAAT